MASFFFGTLYGISEQKALISVFDSIPKELFQIIPYISSIILLVFTSKRSKAPKALGIPYINSGR
jgi:simple sugar transport system permease protein